MKYKKLLLSFLVLVAIFLIYILNVDKKMNYIALGDSLAAGQNPYGQVNYGYTDYIANYLEKNHLLKFYTKKFSESGYRTTDLLNDIKTNRHLVIDEKNYNLKSTLRESDLVTLSIGANDLISQLNFSSPTFELEDVKSLKEKMDTIINKVDETLTEIKKYAKGDIIVVGYYNPLPRLTVLQEEKVDQIMDYINNLYKKLCEKHDVFYVDIYKTFKNNLDYLPNPFDIHPSIKGYEAIASKVIDIIEKEIIN